jgi:hypothetical protein
MTAILLRILVIALIFGAIWLGLRRIWRDWQKQFKAEEAEIHQRDVEERKRPDVITLKRDADGTFRPPDNDNR